jgi:hypothetical protein
VINALLLPAALLCLFLLARGALDTGLRPSGWRGAGIGAAFLLAAGLGLYAGLAGVLG